MGAALPFRIREHDPISADGCVVYGGIAVDVPEERAVLTTLYWHWPCDSETMKVATVFGPLTEEAKARAESAARDWLRSSAPAGTTDLVCRVRPEWTSQYNFETIQFEHRLHMRGAFCGDFPQ